MDRNRIVLGRLLSALDYAGGHNVNAGGCAVVAAILTTVLEANGFSAVGRACDSWFSDGDVDAARNNIPDPDNATAREWNDNDIHFGHVIVQVGHEDWGFTEYFVDSRNEFEVKDGSEFNEWPGESCHGYGLASGSLRPSELVSIARRRVGWNRCFKRYRIASMIDAVRAVCAREGLVFPTILERIEWQT